MSPTAGCQVVMAVQLVGPAPTPHAALGGHPQDIAQSVIPPHPRTAVRRSYEGLVASSRYDLPVMRSSCRELKPLSVASALGVSIHAAVRQGQANTHCVEAELQ